MDKPTIRALLKEARYNLKVAREQWKEIKKASHMDWELEEAQAEVFAQEEIIRFLEANLNRV
jgi:hypothetical protein